MAKTSALVRTHGFGEAHTAARADYLSRRGPAARRERAEQRARIAASLRFQKRSPLHPRALRMCDITIGRAIIVFNLEYGILDEGVVTEGPHPSVSDFGSSTDGMAVITLMQTTGHYAGESRDRSFCTDMGLEPYGSGWWNDRNFTIDAADRDSLPAPDPSLRRNFPHYGFEDGDYGWDEDIEEFEMTED